MVKQQQQQPQPDEGPQRTCSKCGSQSFFHNVITDPTSARNHHMYRCKVCDGLQWSSDADAN